MNADETLELFKAIRDALASVTAEQAGMTAGVISLLVEKGVVTMAEVEARMVQCRAEVDQRLPGILKRFENVK